MSADKPKSPPVKWSKNKVRLEVGEDVRDYVTGQQRVTMVPLKICRKNTRTVLVPPPGSSSVLSAGGEDLPMIKTLGKAFYWQKLLNQGAYASIADMARAMRLEPGWMAEVLRMTNLAPDIIEAVLNGTQPRQLDLQTLRGRNSPLPRDWHEQRVLFGFIDSPESA